VEPGETRRAATFAVKRGDVRDLLAVMTDADPTLASLGPPGFLGRASVWATNAPLAELRETLLESAGLQESIEDERRVLRRPGGPEDPPVPVAAVTPERRLTFGPEDIEARELELAGVASGGSGWLAFAYSPTGALFAYRPGSRIYDGVVRAVESTDLTLETVEGPLRVLLPSAGR